MADVTIGKVSGKNYYKIRFKDWADKTGYEYKIFWSEDIITIGKDNLNGFVVIELTGGILWKFSMDGITGTLTIDKIGSNTPTDNDELATLLADLKG